MYRNACLRLVASVSWVDDQTLELDDNMSAACRSSCCCSSSCARRALDYDAAQCKRGSEMPKRPDGGVIAEQVIERLKQIEDQVTQNQRLADELGHLRRGERP